MSIEVYTTLRPNSDIYFNTPDYWIYWKSYTYPYPVNSGWEAVGDSDPYWTDASGITSLAEYNGCRFGLNSFSNPAFTIYLPTIVLSIRCSVPHSVWPNPPVRLYFNTGYYFDFNVTHLNNVDLHQKEFSFDWLTNHPSYVHFQQMDYVGSAGPIQITQIYLELKYNLSPSSAAIF